MKNWKYRNNIFSDILNLLVPQVTDGIKARFNVLLGVQESGKSVLIAYLFSYFKRYLEKADFMRVNRIFDISFLSEFFYHFTFLDDAIREGTSSRRSMSSANSIDSQLFFVIRHLLENDGIYTGLVNLFYAVQRYMMLDKNIRNSAHSYFIKALMPIEIDTLVDEQVLPYEAVEYLYSLTEATFSFNENYSNYAKSHTIVTMPFYKYWGILESSYATFNYRLSQRVQSDINLELFSKMKEIGIPYRKTTLRYYLTNKCGYSIEQSENLAEEYGLYLLETKNKK